MMTHASVQRSLTLKLFRSHFTRWAMLMLLVAILPVMGLPQAAFAAASPSGATIASDLADYPPGATVTLTGTGWAPGEIVDITVNDDVGQTWIHNSNPDPAADSSGRFTYSFQLPAYFVATYFVLASGPTSGTATTNFTDGSIGTYDQCSNDTGTGYTTGDTGCRWINGNLQQNNSSYVEGDSTVQRAWLTEYVPGSSHTVTFQYGTTKGGKHAYDFLTTWNRSESWITDADRCQGVTGCTSATDATFPIPQDPNANGYDNFSRNFVIRGGTITNVSTPTMVSGSYAGDSETTITVSFTVANSGGPMCSTKSNVETCSVVIWFGAHVATQANWGSGTGAGSISGSPYHVALAAVDGASIGQRDNQMQSDSITSTPNGTIVVIKNAVPDYTQVFNYTLTNGTTITQNFGLDDDGTLPNSSTTPNSQSFSVPQGNYTVTELALPGNWYLSSLVCVDPSGNTTTSGAIANINLASNETVTCTYTNNLAPASVYLTTFNAKVQNARVNLKWKTANELNVAGFNVWRSTKRSVGFVKLNSEEISALHPGELIGDKYAFWDKSAKVGKTYYYKIEVLAPSGTLEWSDVKKVQVP